MILADTSAWVEFDRATGSAVDRRMAELIASDGPLAVTEPVLMEVLAGARDDRRAADLRRSLLRCQLLTIDPAADFDAAARVYRRCRRVGVTPRSLVDCLVVAVAWRSGASVLARDVDVDRVCEVMGVPSEAPATDRPSQRPAGDSRRSLNRTGSRVAPGRGRVRG